MVVAPGQRGALEDWNSTILSYTSPCANAPIDIRPELWVCGYIPQMQLLQRLLPKPHSKAHVLDFGCGNGRVARFLTEHLGCRVTGVDINPAAVERAKRFGDGVPYLLIDRDRLSGLGPFDACICNHVFPIYGSTDLITRSLRVIQKHLRPETGYVLVNVDNTNHTGIKYTSFVPGEPGAVYKSGDQIRTCIMVDGAEVMEVDDYFWTPTDYMQCISSAGFVDRSMVFPTPTLAAGRLYRQAFGVALPQLAIEQQYPPFAIYVGRRASSEVEGASVISRAQPILLPRSVRGD